MIDLETKLKYASPPILSAKTGGEWACASMYRALFIQKHDKRMKELKEMINDIDFHALLRTSYIVNHSPEEILYSFFSAIGYKKEYEVMTEEKAEKIMKILEKNNGYISRKIRLG